MARKLLLLLEACSLDLEGFRIGRTIEPSVTLLSSPIFVLLLPYGCCRVECYGRVLNQVTAREYLTLDAKPLFLGFPFLTHSPTYIARLLPSGTFFPQALLFSLLPKQLPLRSLVHWIGVQLPIPHL